MHQEQERTLRIASQETLRRIEEDFSRVTWRSKDILECIRKNFLESDFNVSILKAFSKENGSYRMEDFRAELGVSPMNYITGARLETASYLLRDTTFPIGEVSYLSGFSEVVGFRATFKRWVGMAPSEYRRRTISVAKEIGWPIEPIFNIRFWAKLERGEVEKEEVKQLHAWFGSLYGISQDDHPGSLGRLLVEFFHNLGEISVEEGRLDRQRAVETAKTALVFLDVNKQTLGDTAKILRPLGLARLANARRLALDFTGAEKDFRRAEEGWEKVDHIGDLRVKAEIYFLEATFLEFQGKLTQAQEKLGFALAFCRESDAPGLLSKILIQSAKTKNYLSHHLSAIKDLEEAIELLRPEDSYLKQVAYGNLAAACIWAKKTDQALKNLAQARKFCDPLKDPLGHNLLFWLEGLVKIEEKEISMAEVALRTARLGLVEMGERGYVAVISVELALLCHKQKRWAEALDLASVAIPILEVFKIPEAANAVRLLKFEITSDSLKQRTLQRVRKCLWNLYRNPSAPLANNMLTKSVAVAV